MKFPKEVVQISNKVKEYIQKEDYLEVYKIRQEILDNLTLIKEINPEVLDSLIMSTYVIGDSDRTILIGEELLRNEYESFTQVYYILLSYLANSDIFEAVSFIKRSKLLNDSEVKPYFGNDQANYSGLLKFEFDITKCLALVVANLTMEIKKESIIIEVIDKSYLFYRFYDVVNLLNEIGFSNEIVLKLSDDVRNVFMADI